MDIKRFFSKDTREGRAVRTGIQAFLSFLSFVYGLLVIPGLDDLLAGNGVVTLATFATWTGLVSYVYNQVERLLKWLDNE